LETVNIKQDESVDHPAVVFIDETHVTPTVVNVLKTHLAGYNFEVSVRQRVWYGADEPPRVWLDIIVKDADEITTSLLNSIDIEFLRPDFKVTLLVSDTDPEDRSLKISGYVSMKVLIDMFFDSFPSE
jgi:hypothetical protein